MTPADAGLSFSTFPYCPLLCEIPALLKSFDVTVRILADARSVETSNGSVSVDPMRTEISVSNMHMLVSLANHLNGNFE